MHPYVIDRMVQERQDELLRLARAGRRVRASRGWWPGSRRGTSVPASTASASDQQLTPACCPG
jgi:hypothetical protein